MPLKTIALALAALLLLALQPCQGAETTPGAKQLPASVLPISDCPSAPSQPDPQLLRYLDTRSAGAGRWRADNAEIAFSTNWTGTYQKWRMSADGGFPEQITFFEDQIDSCDFSPVDPNLMLCSVAAGGNERQQLYLLNSSGANLRPLAEDPAYVHRPGGWSRDGKTVAFVQNNRDQAFFDVWLADVATGKLKPLWAPGKNLAAGAFSPNGNYLVVSEGISNFDGNLYLLDVNAILTEPILLTPHTVPARFDSARWADDHTLYALSDQDRDFMGIIRLDESKPGQPETVYAPQADVDSLNISPDGHYIAWTENHDGYEQAHIAALPGLQALPAPQMPAGVQGVGAFSWDNHFLLLQVSGISGPGDLYRYELATGTTKRLTVSGTGGLDPAGFIAPQVVSMPSFDGLPVSGLWYEPHGVKPAGGWPTVVMPHGGPEGQAQPYFSSEIQLFLSHGLAVLEPNPRGSTGFGKAFSHLDDVGKRLDSVRDYVAFRDWLIAQGKSDPKRIAISGGSYGGYVVLAALTFFPDKFTCGVCQFGIANFTSFLQNTASYRRPQREAEYGSLERDKDLLPTISPLPHITAVTAPLLIMQGANDPRVPLSESTQMYDALKAQNKDVELLVFADEGHGFVKRENRAIAWGTELNFLTKHLALAP